MEIWQADAAGLYNSPGERRGKADPAFAGWGRQPTDGATGQYRFETIKPGRVPFVDGRPMAPHVTFWIVARGINLGLHTRMYFSDEAAANAECPVLARIEHRDRVATLIAARGEENGIDGLYVRHQAARRAGDGLFRHLTKRNHRTQSSLRSARNDGGTSDRRLRREFSRKTVR